MDNSWRVLLLALALLFEVAASAVYYTVSRAYFADILGSDSYSFIVLVSAIEVCVGLIGPLAGYLGDVYGRWLLASIGFIRLPLLPLIPLLDGFNVLPIILLYSLASTVFWSNTLGYILEARWGSAIFYAKATILLTLGWALGSLAPGVLGLFMGYNDIFIVLGLTYVIPPILAVYAVIGSGRNLNSKPGKSLKLTISIPIGLFISLIALAAGLNIFWSIFSIKLYYELNRDILIYGLISGTLPALVSAIIRPIAGLAVDKFGEKRILVYTIIAYIIYSLLVYNSSGLILAILWLIPIYPFKDIAQTMYISKRLPPELQATAAGILTQINSISSLLNIIAYPIVENYGLLGGLVVNIILLTLSVVILVRLN
ncbi:MAG: MFS transporter [Acidilobaceae archaeon]